MSYIFEKFLDTLRVWINAATLFIFMNFTINLVSSP